MLRGLIVLGVLFLGCQSDFPEGSTWHVRCEGIEQPYRVTRKNGQWEASHGRRVVLPDRCAFREWSGD